MLASVRPILVFALLGAAPTVSAQVINGESTYGDSDLHQPPAATAGPADNDRRDVPPQPPPQPGRR